MANLYENIRKRREALGMSQNELATKTGYSDRTSISKIESGNDTLVNKVTITGTSAYDDVMAVYNRIPEKVLEGAVVFVGADMFRKFVQELVAKNYYHYDGKPVDGEIMIPGTNNKVIAVNGLNGTEKIFAARPQDIYFGTDMEGDEEAFDFWYSKDNQEFRLAIKFNAGAQYSFSDQVVLGFKA